MDVPDAATLGDLVARQRRSDDLALVAVRADRRYDYRRFCTTAWKTGNFWRRRGVHAGSTVTVAADPVPEAAFALFGAALLGARTRFGLPGARAAARAPGLDARVVAAHRDDVDALAVSAGTQRVAYGGPPDDPGVAHFERDVWSENPAFPETAVDPESVALVARDDCESVSGDDCKDTSGDDCEYSHADLLSAAHAIVDDWELEPGDEVAVRTSLADPGTVVAGVLAPLVAGAAILFPGDDAVGDVAVAGAGDPPESRTVAPSAVL